MSRRTNLRLAPQSIPDLPIAIEIPPDGLIIGRDPSCDIVLDTEDYPTVSSRHVRIGWDAGRLVAEDLGSKNGTWVDDQRVEEAHLTLGSKLSLGPADAVVFTIADREHAQSLTQTVELGAVLDAVPDHSGVGRTTIIRLREVLDAVDPDGELSTRRSGPSRATWAALLIIAVGTVIGFSMLFTKQRESEEAFRLQDREFAAAIEKERKERESEREQLDARRAELDRKQADLEERLAEVSEGSAEDSDIDELREQLRSVNKQIALYEPLRLDAEAEIALRDMHEKTLAATVYISNQVFLHEPESGQFAMRRNGTTEVFLGDLDDPAGQPVRESQSGTGFCILERGLIVTNAHVVETEVPEKIPQGEVTFHRKQILEIVFSGTTERIPVRVVSKLTTDRDDFALIEILRPGTYPAVPDFDVDRSIPARDTEIRLFGFPLGRRLPQKGDRLEASLFSGSVSRQDLDPYVQVQSVVYPGTSGGPAVDEEGRVFGVITAVATAPSGQIASDIGYVLPIQRMKTLLEGVN